MPAEVAVTTRRVTNIAALVVAILADGTLAFAQPQSREPVQPGRRIGAKDGDLIVVDHDARVGFLRRRQASIRLIYNADQRWVVLLADYAPAEGAPDGFVDYSFSWRQLEGRWPLDARWEGSAILEDYSAPGISPTSLAIVVPSGRIQFKSPGPVEALFADPQALAVLRHGSAGGGMVGRLTFDQAEEQAVRNAIANASNPSFSTTTMEARAVGGAVTVSNAFIATANTSPATPSEPNAPVRVGGSVGAAKKIHDVAAIYPESMRQSGVSGVVILEITIERDGSVRSAKLLRGIAPAIDQAALDAAKQWKYEPVLLNGAPVPAIVTATVAVKP